MSPTIASEADHPPTEQTTSELACEKIVRLRGEARKKELAEVAERVFLRHGFADATMQMIAAEARASKETLYRYFTSKEALFSEIVHNRAMTLFGPTGALPSEGAPCDVLFSLGYRLLETMTRPDSLALYRVVVAESPRAPSLGALFYQQGPAHVHNELAAYLALATSQGRLDCPDAKTACRLFLGAAIGNYNTQALVSSSPDDLNETFMRDHVSQAVGLFLARYGTPSSGSLP